MNTHPPGRHSPRSMPVSAAYGAFCLLLVVMLHSGPAIGATIMVDTASDEFDFFGPNDQCSLREAIAAANGDVSTDSCAAGSGDDEIVFDPALTGATIVLDIEGRDEDDGVTGDLDIEDNDGDALTITGPREGDPASIFIDGNETDRVFHAFTPLRLRNATVRKGASVLEGAGIRTESDVSLVLEQTTVRDNVANVPSEGGVFAHGGGLYLLGPATIEQSRVAANTAKRFSDAVRGGGIYFNATTGITLNVINSVISGNAAVTDGGGSVQGGGIHMAGGELIITDSVLEDNRAVADPSLAGTNAFGGALNIDFDSNLTVTDSTLRNNTVRLAGDGAGMGGAAIQLSTSATGQIRRSEISSNAAESADSTVRGAGIDNNGTLELTNTTISGNTTVSGSSDAQGGGLFVNDIATLTLNNTTVTANLAQTTSGTANGGGIYNNGGAITPGNSIIAGNDADTDGPDCFGDVMSADFNLLGDDTDCGFAAMGDDLLNMKPQLGPLADNGGPTQTHGLLEGSPAIDAADPNDPAGGGTCETEDQRGEPRPQDGDGDGGARCDMGALESIPAGLGGSGGGGDDDDDGGCAMGSAGGPVDPLLAVMALLAMAYVAKCQRRSGFRIALS